MKHLLKTEHGIDYEFTPSPWWNRAVKAYRAERRDLRRFILNVQIAIMFPWK